MKQLDRFPEEDGEQRQRVRDQNGCNVERTPPFTGFLVPGQEHDSAHYGKNDWQQQHHNTFYYNSLQTYRSIPNPWLISPYVIIGRSPKKTLSATSVQAGIR